MSSTNWSGNSLDAAREAWARSGRRAIEVSLARQVGLVAGFHFSSRHLRVAISDVGRTVVVRQQGNLSGAARLLGLTRPQLTYRLKRERV